MGYALWARENLLIKCVFTFIIMNIQGSGMEKLDFFKWLIGYQLPTENTIKTEVHFLILLDVCIYTYPHGCL